jgi:hypothetical protein
MDPGLRRDDEKGELRPGGTHPGQIFPWMADDPGSSVFIPDRPWTAAGIRRLQAPVSRNIPGSLLPSFPRKPGHLLIFPFTEMDPGFRRDDEMGELSPGGTHPGQAMEDK